MEEEEEEEGSDKVKDQCQTKTGIVKSSLQTFNPFWSDVKLYYKVFKKLSFKSKNVIDIAKEHWTNFSSVGES